MKFREIDWESCKSMSEDRELVKLSEWCEQLTTKLNRELLIIEVGCFKGRSTCILAQYGNVIAIDLFGNVDSGMGKPELIGTHHYAPFMDNIKRLELLEIIHPVVSTSSVLSLVPPMHADVVFVDASHKYHEVVKDIQYTESHVHKDHGLWIFHDYKRPGWFYPPTPGEEQRSPNRDPWEGVARALDERLEKGGWDVHEHCRGIICLRRSLEDPHRV